MPRHNVHCSSSSLHIADTIKVRRMCVEVARRCWVAFAAKVAGNSEYLSSSRKDGPTSVGGLRVCEEEVCLLSIVARFGRND